MPSAFLDRLVFRRRGAGVPPLSDPPPPKSGALRRGWCLKMLIGLEGAHAFFVSTVGELNTFALTSERSRWHFLR
jgi:hypothetical protein